MSDYLRTRGAKNVNKIARNHSTLSMYHKTTNLLHFNNITDRQNIYTTIKTQ